MVNFINKFIFVIGGSDPQIKILIYASVERYDINKNSWSSGPDLNIPRKSHSSCVLSDHIYTFCGCNKKTLELHKYQYLSSIERLDA